MVTESSVSFPSLQGRWRLDVFWEDLAKSGAQTRADWFAQAVDAEPGSHEQQRKEKPYLARQHGSKMRPKEDTSNYDPGITWA